MKPWKKNLLEIIVLLIITIPSFYCLINKQYFAMHDDQQISRLYLLDQAIRQGNLYPRWVGELGFNFGYPLFNFYPPLVYYVGEIFHLIGFNFIMSIKLTFILGFILAAVGSFYFLKRLVGKWPAFLASTLYTYFFYHAVNGYVRGALAEFFSMAILPFMFLALDNLFKKPNIKSSFLFGLMFAILILTHPLIAFPSVFFIGFFFIFYYCLSKDKSNFVKKFLIGVGYGLGLSAFFWLPSLVEKKYTLVDDLLTHELASYKIHFVYLQQFWYSAWGYGGSIAGPNDGLTFQLGKVDILLVAISLILFIGYLFNRKKSVNVIKYFSFFIFLLLFSLFMCSTLSASVWEKIKYLWYLQFPWRFLTFTAFFISIIAAMSVFFLQEFLNRFITKEKTKIIIIFLTILISLSVIVKYQRYFQPVRFLNNTDKQLTSFDEITWRVSKTSFEFSPKGIKTAKTDLNTTTIGLTKDQIKINPYEVKLIGIGETDIKIINNLFEKKEFIVNTALPLVFQLNTFNFPGWQAKIDGKKVLINDKNDYKLMTVDVPIGKHEVSFIFTDTPIRVVGNILFIISIFLLVVLILTRKNIS